jgi:UDP-N-acetylglucosamine 3-dehydrogenase
MAKLRVGFIGTGMSPERPSLMGYAMAHHHATAFAALADTCEMAACADILEGNARAFAAKFGIPSVYVDYHEMLAKEGLDLVSICTWPNVHAEMAIACAQAGCRACHCEKPMDLTYGGAVQMLQASEQHGMKLTFNHQRRYGKPFRKAKDLIDWGEIGPIVRMEAGMSDLYDFGTHWIDMLNYFNSETPAHWVIGGVDCRVEKRAFGAPLEWQGICQVRYRNGVHAIMTTGEAMHSLGVPIRVHGAKGIIEIAWGPSPGPMLRYWRNGLAEWQAVDCGGEDLHGPCYIERAIADVVDCLLTGRDCELSARHAMNATEILFAFYESARRRARIDLPLGITDSPLVCLIESGQVPFVPRP